MLKINVTNKKIKNQTIIKHMLHFVFLLVFFSSCKCYTSEEMQPSNYSSEKANIDVLRLYEAEDKKYTLLIFTHEYKGEIIIVKNKNEIFNNTPIKTIETNSLAKIVRIRNDKDFKIYDQKHIIKIKKELSISYKFIYIEKNEFLKTNVGSDSIIKNKKVKNKNKIYKVIYSNDLQRFM